MTMPVNRVATYLAAMGVVVDRTSCRNHVQNTRSNYVMNNARYMEPSSLFGIHLPRSVMSLAALSASTDEGSCIEWAEALAACGFPSAQGTAFHLPFP